MASDNQTADGRKIIEGLEEAVAHARGEVSLQVTVRLPDRRKFQIDTERDVEAGVWIATSPDVGLVMGETWAEMMSKVTDSAKRIILLRESAQTKKRNER